MSPARSHPQRRAFTLIELVLSMAIVTLVCAACFSVTTLLLRAAGATADTASASQSAAARDAMAQVTSDLKMATSISEQTSSAITFTIPDRDGDGSAETIRYAWAGAGQPLTRQYNGGAAVTILPSAQAFALSYITQTVGPPPPTTTGEQLIYSYDDATSTAKYGPKSATWGAMYIKPTLPGTALSWSITRVKIQGIKKSNNIIYSVEVRAIDASNKPTGSALGTVSLNSNSLTGSPTWLDLPLTTPANSLNPANGYAIIVRGTNSGTVGINFYYDNSTTSSTSRGWTTTTNSGSSWTAPSNTQAMQVYVYGTITTP